MLGAGVFAAVAPAAEAAGSLLLAGLAIAAAVAYANATSSAQLAALHPEAGGTYVYARERLGEYWGFLAGWAFVIGKSASLAAMALTFGSYLAPQLARPVGIVALAVLTVVNYRGIEKTARASLVFLLVVLATLAVVTVAGLLAGDPAVVNLSGRSPEGWLGVLRSAGILFFAFAGYARIATLGEEVIVPARTIPRAIPAALGIAVAIYSAVMLSALVAVGPQTLANSDAPLLTVVEESGWRALSPIVRLGAAAACAGALVSLLAGVSRTVLSMARRRELPRMLDAVHPRFRSPHRAELVTSLVVGLAVLAADLRSSIGFSSFAVLAYYALTNASAWTLPPGQRRWPRRLAALGFGGCLILAITLPEATIVSGFVLLLAGSGVWLFSRNVRRPS